MPDILSTLAAETQYTENDFSYTAPHPVLIAQQNPLRYSLLFTYAGAANGCFTTNPSRTTVGGIVLTARSFIQLTVKDYGSLVQAPWYFLSNIGVDNCSVFEMFFTKGV